ncbi:MAG: DNA polymerase III subunit gamma/tau [Syntrophales bacterium]|nr:DNA polymerase III subunit gamma/tau [Syntrophales bacterium]
MGYIVLARKWRPRVFEDVVGQEHVVKTLRNAILQGRVAHAFIFSGPRGIGKTSVARIMAKALNCEQGPAAVPCDKCANCLEITKGISLDVREIDGASNRGIDEIRELRENVKFSPASSLYKIYIIDEIHMLTREAFNALLKTLEEPPLHVIFIFATTEIHKVPATIISRCQCFEFRRVSIKMIMGNLKQIAEKESVRISETSLTWIAEAGDGSIRDAQSIFDQVISYAGLDISESDVEGILGRTDKRFLFALSGAVLERNAAECLEVINEAYYAGLDMKYFYQMLLGHFRNLLFTMIAGEPQLLLDLVGDEIAKLKAQTEGVSKQTLQHLLEILMAEEENVRRSYNPRLDLEMIIIRMAYMEPMIPIDEIMLRMEGLEKRLSATKPSPELTGTLQVETVSPLSAGYEVREGHRPEQIWEDFKNFVKKQSSPLWSKIEAGKFLAYEDKILRVGFLKDYIFLDNINESSQKRRLTEMARELFRDDEIKLNIELLEPEGRACEKGQNGSYNNNRTNEIKREALNHPMLQKVIDIFGGAEVREVIPRLDYQKLVK